MNIDTSNNDKNKESSNSKEKIRKLNQEGTISNIKNVVSKKTNNSKKQNSEEILHHSEYESESEKSNKNNDPDYIISSETNIRIENPSFKSM